MKIINAKWGRLVNTLIIKCDCGARIEHRSDRWKVACPWCKRVENLAKLRDNIRPGDIEA